MLFNSINYLIFFPTTAIVFWSVQYRYRIPWLLMASYFFYFNIKPIYALLVLYVTFVTWGFSLVIDKADNNDIGRRKYLWLSVAMVLLPLLFFKYYGVINHSMLSLLEVFNMRWPLPDIKFLLPIGISYYTFVSIGYIVDVYNGEFKAEKSFLVISLFLSFFPLILSGPIERGKNIIPQLKKWRKFSTYFITAGLKMMLWGFFMKLVVADRLGLYVDAVYNNLSHHNGTTLLFASVLYSFQVYADLGGYSLVAIGTAKLLGINVIPNFNRPFCAMSMADFWRRWHISLITWLTDYVYTPLAFTFRKYKYYGIVISLLITFLLSGIWHGPAMTFLVWGLMQGVFLSFEALTANNRIKVENRFNLKNSLWYVILCVAGTFALFTFSLIISRGNSINDAVSIYLKIYALNGDLFIGSPSSLIYGGFGLALILAKDIIEEYAPSKFLLFDNRNVVIRFLSYSAIFFIIVLFGVFDGGQFIYFQF